MNYSLEYIDIILLAMIAGFIFLRLRGILGKKTGFEGKMRTQFTDVLSKSNLEKKIKKDFFDEVEQNEFLRGAKIAYETIIKDFSDSDNELTVSKSLLGDKIFNQFKLALKERAKKGHYAEITFIGVNSAIIKDHKKVNNFLEVTVDFVSEIITSVKDKDKKIISGDPEKIKKVYDTWIFSRDMNSKNPNWQLVNTITQVRSEITNKDKKEWQNFVSSKEKLTNKDDSTLDQSFKKITKKIDLHGYSLEDANKIMKQFIKDSFQKNVNKIIVITGKGLHSKNEKNPYVSKDLSILKYSVPEYIESNPILMKKIINITDANIEDGGSGAFYIYLKKNR